MTTTEKRKDEHLSINTEKDVKSGLLTGFERYSFVHQALPEINLKDVSTGTNFLGYPLKLPLLISSMTGGTQEGDRINHNLAEAAQANGIAMGVGSQRADIEKGNNTGRSFLRKAAPDIPIFANLGAIQLNYGYTITECQKAVEMIEADALILHLNPLQEALQPEGQTEFAGLSVKIEQICKQLSVPLIVKEVGWGISPETARRLVELGVAGIDVAGAGGTSWSEVEKYRSHDEARFRIAARFKDWGIPTAECLKQVHAVLPDLPLIASGGITSGLDIAKTIALGATLAGIARPFLIAAKQSTEEVIARIEEIERELRITMFAAGAADMNSLASLTLQDR